MYYWLCVSSYPNADDDDEEDEEKDIAKKIKPIFMHRAKTFYKDKSFSMLGTILLLVFSAPIVHVLQEMAVMMGNPPIYVSFVLASLDATSSEELANFYNTSNKTSTSIAIPLAAFKGAAAMNSTFCPSIFITGLIYFRGLALQYAT